MTEPWVPLLARGDPEGAWDRFLDRYRRLVFGAIRRCVAEPDDVMDVFALVCEGFRRDDFRRLRRCAERVEPGRPISTYIVAVVHNIAIDWIRARDGRPRGALASSLPPPRDRIYRLVFEQRHSHVEAYETLHAADASLTFGVFLRELRATYRAAQHAGRTVENVFVAQLCAPESDPGLEADRRNQLETVLEALAPEDRVAVELYVMEDLPAEQVARMMGYPGAKAVYNRVYRALGELRERLEAAGIGRDSL